MMRYEKYQNQECFLCGRRNLFVENYLILRSENILRNIACLASEKLAKLVGKISMVFERKYRPVLFCFFEVPNIANLEISSCMTHTPHTYMLSENSFFLLEKMLPVKVQSIEAVGPSWNKHYRILKSNSGADRRVLLRRIAKICDHRK